MTPRDRTVLGIAGLVAVLAGFWFLAIAPRRAESQRLAGEITQARQARDSALASASAALAAQRGHASDEAIIARLGKAVPSDDDTASLLYQLDSAAGRAHVDFRSVRLDGTAAVAAPAPAPAPATATATTPASTTPTASQAAAAPLPPGATIGPAGLSKLPFVLTFEGNFFGLERFLRRLHSFTSVKGQTISVRGRLLAVDGISLAVSPDGFPKIRASLTVSAFLAPPASATAVAATAPATAQATTAPTTAQAPPTTPATVVGVTG